MLTAVMFYIAILFALPIYQSYKENEIFRRRLEDTGKSITAVVCVQGMWQRLEMESKLANLIEPNAASILAIIGNFDSGPAEFSNNRTKLQGDHVGNCRPNELDMSANQLSARFESFFGDAKLNRLAFAVLEEPKEHIISIETRQVLSRYRVNSPDRERRLQNHIRQFRHDAACLAEIEKLPANISQPDFVIRIRDNGIVVAPMILQQLSHTESISVKGCASWGGVNDKVWIVPKRYFKAVLNKTYESLVSSPEFLRNERPVNSETLLAKVWRHHKVKIRNMNLPVVDARCNEKGDFELVSSHKDCRPQRMYRGRLNRPRLRLKELQVNASAPLTARTLSRP
jgi:hypothetical protein